MRCSRPLSRFVCWRALVLAALTIPGWAAHAQDLDSRGREFWLAFMANLGGDNTPSELLLYLSAQRPTTARITWVYSGQSITVPIPLANQTVEVNLSGAFSSLVELDDVFPGNPYNEKISKAIHVVADGEIAVVGLNYRYLSADAFLALPIDVLTGEYVVVSHRNGFSTGVGYDTPSQFCIVGAEDGTTVRVVPISGLHINGRVDDAPFAVTLDAGDVFFAQAQLGEPADVTGTQVVANKPVSVFSGVKRASIPTWWGNYRDHLVEQLVPLQSWGQNALVTPHYAVTSDRSDTAEYRVTAAFGPTDVFIVGSIRTDTVTLGAGEIVTRPLIEAVSVKATGPILVTQYERSTPNTGAGDATIGDPFMMIVPPVEQFDTSCTVQSIGFTGFRDDYHFMNLVVAANGAAGLTIDGGVPPGLTWRAVPGSRYAYAQARVRPGSHLVRADSPFAVYAYGYGYANSYGYPGSMVFRRLVKDVSPPEIQGSQLCGLYQAIATDSKIADSGIDSLFATTDTVNVTVSIPPFAPDADTVFFSARLNDPYLDGLVAVRAVDSAGLSFTQKSDLPGFTLGVQGSRTGPVVVDTVVAINSNLFCRRLPIVNYGRFAQTIFGIRLLDSVKGTRITTSVPIRVDPGDTTIIEVCFTDVVDTAFTTRLELEGSCSSRIAALIPVDSRLDTSAPGIRRDGSPCADEVVVTYSKEDRGSKIASLEIDTTVNCSIEILNDPTTQPMQTVRVKVKRIDARYDMVYGITVVDSVGNTVTDLDTIGGFTIVALDATRDSLGLRWDRSWEGDTVQTSSRRCDSIELVNYGMLSVELSGVRLRGNVRFSSPPSQFPMTIAPGAARMVEICMESPYPFDHLDTLELLDRCGHVELVPLRVASGSLVGSGSDGCNGTIEMSVYEAAKRTFMTSPAPNPMGGGGYVDIGLAAPDVVTIEVIDMSGHSVATIVRSAPTSAGVARVTFDLTTLGAGSYLVHMRTGSGESAVQRLIITR